MTRSQRRRAEAKRKNISESETSPVLPLPKKKPGKIGMASQNVNKNDFTKSLIASYKDPEVK